MPELIITEKPNASKRIAEALTEGKLVKDTYKGVPFYKILVDGKTLYVGCAVGHLFGLAEKNKTKNFQYPVFEVEWKPVYEVSKGGAFSKKYYEALKKLAKEADKFTVATDYDVEGEVIGLNIIRYICNRNDARRMKFSTLTKPDIVKAYEQASPKIDWGQALAGETRHYLDYYYGINISRALITAMSKAGQFKLLSTGRVQGPALKILADREREIQAFKPVPYWMIELNGVLHKQTIQAWHEKDKFWKKEEAESVYKKVHKETQGNIADVQATTFQQLQPTPFDLTTLQTEAYRCFGINPKTTLEIAQELYTNGCISYPRTSSQQLPASIGYKNILHQLAKQKQYKQLAETVLKGPLIPRQGKKTDPAHPAIYPTGITPKGIEGREEKVYDLIVKRFFSVFGQPARRETVKITIEVKGENFVAQGSRTIELGWHTFYAPYVKLEEVELPAAKKGDKTTIKKISQHEDQTKPPKRYTPASIIKELEKRNLGTKATRAEIIDTLLRRNYAIGGDSLQVTELGFQTVKVLEEHCPKILDEELTRKFEADMEDIREQKKKQDQVLGEAKKVLIEILKDFKAKEKQIGKDLLETFAETRATLTTVGPCPECKKGTLALRKGKFGRFIACDKYPDCKTTFHLPASGLVQVSPETCKTCGYPEVKIIRKAKKPQIVCINQNCKSKATGEGFVTRPCPKCQTGKLVVKRSIYGAFIACDSFPKCRYTERLKPVNSESLNNKPDK